LDSLEHRPAFYADLEPAPVAAATPQQWESFWAECSLDAKHLLIHVAREGVVNPYQRPLVIDLVKRGFLRFAPDLQPSSDEFAVFLIGKQQELQADLRNWEHVDAAHSWALCPAGIIYDAGRPGAVPVQYAARLAVRTTGYRSRDYGGLDDVAQTVGHDFFVAGESEDGSLSLPQKGAVAA
jgi:hypothetical protein